MDSFNKKSITELARELRRNQTPSEKKLWQEIRYRRVLGYRFLRQKPIIYRKNKKRTYFFIADFYCAEKKLVIELDGKIHDFQKEYDNQRDLVMKQLGVNVLRIKNEELKNMNKVLDNIKSVLRD